MVLVTPYEGDKTKETYAIVGEGGRLYERIGREDSYITIADWNQVAKSIQNLNWDRPSPFWK